VEGDCITSSHLNTSHLVRLLWARDRPVAKASVCTTHTIDKRQKSVLPAGIEPSILVTVRPQTHALDSAASGIGRLLASEADFRSNEVVSYVNNPCTNTGQQLAGAILKYSHTTRRIYILMALYFNNISE
jgi:hypothetical protein